MTENKIRSFVITNFIQSATPNSKMLNLPHQFISETSPLSESKESRYRLEHCSLTKL
jgi:hypothetical protein